ncbi:uncharacterized protein LOC144165333 [Haemaphysalis longicornis]
MIIFSASDVDDLMRRQRSTTSSRLRSSSGPHLSTLELRSRTLPSTMSHGNHHESTPPVAPIICPGTVRQRDPPFFNGADDQDAEDWLATFQRVSTHNNWDDKHKQNSVSLSFTGVAETWYKNHGSDLRTWSDFKTEFTKVFGRPALRKLRAEQRLRERAQRTNESFTSYIEDILDLCNRANDAMTEQGKIKHILKGIEDDAFQMLIAKNPRTVAEIISACQDFDELRRERALTRKPAEQDHSLCSLASDDKGVLFAQIQQFVREEVARQLSLVGDVVKMMVMVVISSGRGTAETTADPMRQRPKPSEKRWRSGRGTPSAVRLVVSVAMASVLCSPKSSVVTSG